MKKKTSQQRLEEIDPDILLNDGALQVQLALQALCEGKVHLFDPAALRRSKKMK